MNVKKILKEKNTTVNVLTIDYVYKNARIFSKSLEVESNNIRNAINEQSEKIIECMKELAITYNIDEAYIDAQCHLFSAEK